MKSNSGYAIPWMVAFLMTVLVVAALSEGIYILQRDNSTVLMAHECIEAARNDDTIYVGIVTDCDVTVHTPVGLLPIFGAGSDYDVTFEIPNFHVGTDR